MKSAATLLVLLLGAPVFAAPLSVTVVDSKGGPVAGADVQFDSYAEAPKGVVDAVTDAAGAATFQITPAIGGPGYVGRVAVWKREFALGGRIARLNKPMRVVLGEAHSVAGSVFDEEHHPIVGASITFSYSRANRASGGAGILYFSDGIIKQRVTVVSGADGSWKLGNIPADAQVNVTIRSAGRAEANAQIASNGSAQTVLHPGAQISGRLLDLTDQPLAGVPLFVTQQSRDPGNRAGGEGKTGDDGRWTVGGLPQGVYQVSFMPGDAAPFVVATTHDVTATPGTPMQLPDSRAVAGTLIGGKIVAADDAKTPVAGATVMLQSDDDAEHYESATADAGGHWQLRTLEKPGHLYIAGAPPEFIAEEQRRAMVLGAGQMNLDFSLPRAVKVTGRLVDENGQGVANAGLVLRRKGRYDEFAVESDAKGDFTTYVPEVGELEIGTARYSEEVPETQWDVVGGGAVTVATGQPIVIKLRRAELSSLIGGVFDEAGAAVEGAKVVVNVKTPQSVGDAWEPRELISDKAGRIHLEGIRANQKLDFQSATKDGYDTAPLPTIDQQKSLYHADITLKKRGGRATGDVFDATGNAVAGTAIFGSGIETKSDKAGHFTLAPLPAGKTNIFAWHGDGFALAQSDATRLGLKPQSVVPTDMARAKEVIDALYKESDGSGYWNRNSLRSMLPDADFNAAAASARATGEAGIPRVISRFASDPTISTERWVALLRSAPKPIERLVNVSFWESKVTAISDNDTTRALLAGLQDDVATAEKAKDSDQKWSAATGIFAVAGLAERLNDHKAADLLFARGQAYVLNNFAEKVADPRNDQSQDAMFAGIAATVAVSPRLFSKMVGMVEPTSRAYADMLRQGAPALARLGGLEAAKPFLDKLRSTPTPKPDANGFPSNIELNYSQAVKESVDAGGKANPELALELARSLPRNSDMGSEFGRDQAICEVAFFQTPAVAKQLWSESLPKMEAGDAMRFIARIAATDEPLARGFYETVRARLDAQPDQEPNAPRYGPTPPVAAFAFYEARFAPARARYRLEKGFQLAQKDDNGRYELGIYARAMAAFNVSRALQWADLIGNKDNNFAAFEAKRQIARYLAMDEAARSKLNIGNRFHGEDEF